MLPAGTRCTLYGQPDHREHDLRAGARDRRPGRRLHRRLRARGDEPAGQAQGQAARPTPSVRSWRAASAGASRATARRSRRRTRAPARRAASSATSCAGWRSSPASTSPARRPWRSTSTTRPTARRGRGWSRRRRRRPGSAKRKRGFALESMAPPQLFSLPEGGGWHSIRTMSGTYQVRALDSPVSLGALPLDLATARDRDRAARSSRARPLRGVAAGARAGARTSRRSAAATPSPRSGVVELTDYLPFLAAD